VLNIYFKSQQVGDLASLGIIVKQMNRYGRICCCGAISQYNITAPITGELLVNIQLERSLIFVVSVFCVPYALELRDEHQFIGVMVVSKEYSGCKVAIPS
jgi:NADPH-dependent curcumin reductase CurA